MKSKGPKPRQSAEARVRNQEKTARTQHRARRSAAELDDEQKRRGLFRIALGLAIVLAIALIAVGGSHINTHLVQNKQSEESTQPIDYEQVNRGYTKLTKDGGYYYNPNTGLKETWYSQNVLPGGGLEIDGRHVDDDGIVRDGAGYIVCASSDYDKGTIIGTSLGTAKVYDTGCPNGILDIYTAW